MNEVEYPLGVMIGFVLQDGWSPLVSASQAGHVEIVKSLIEAGANVNHTTKVVKIKTSGCGCGCGWGVGVGVMWEFGEGR